ncbi:MAG: hypothetical protein H0T46_11660 [Deltaproteobacteria bacterium]|nr:hypothetical protein [Deltaproteobacteria bacterium]
MPLSPRGALAFSIAVLVVAPRPVASAPPTDPDRLPGEDPPAKPPPRYPLALVERPLVLPSGAVQAMPVLYFSHRSIIDYPSSYYPSVRGAATLDSGMNARVGVAGLELGGHVSFGLLGSAHLDSTNTFQGGGGDVTVGFARSFAITALFHASVASPRIDRYLLRLVLSTKRRLSSRSAVVVHARIGDNHLRNFEMHAPTDTVTVAAGVTVQAQVNAFLGLQGRAYFGYYRQLQPDQQNESLPRSATYVGQDYGIAFVAAVHPAVDIIGGFDLIATGSAFLQYHVGLAFRRVP